MMHTYLILYLRLEKVMERFDEEYRDTEAWDCRTRALIGDEGSKRLKGGKVVVFGLGGVGSFATEALARAGLGSLVLVDFDVINLSNLNRQLIALTDTVGRLKTDVMRERISKINPNCDVQVFPQFVSSENLDNFLNTNIDYVIDAIDSVRSKVDLISNCTDRKIPIVSCMGMGNKLDPSKIKIEDISKTHTCPLARAVRTGLKKKGIFRGVETVFSTEPPVKSNVGVPSSISFVPSTAGLMMASVAVNDMLRR